jgi:hypothetical protein
MSGARERANAVIKYEPYIRPPGSLRRDLEARESWREMWKRVREGDERSKWRSEERGNKGKVGVKVVDRDWLEWCPGRSDGGVEEEEKGITEGGGNEKVGEEAESKHSEGNSSSEPSGGESTDLPSEQKMARVSYMILDA